MNWKVILALVAVALLSSGPSALASGLSLQSNVQNQQSACGCGEFYPTPNDAIQDAGAVFTGEVVSIGDIPAEDVDALREKRIVFRVISSWKNAAGPEVMVDTGPVAEGCGLEFRPGQIWFVYMDRSRVADRCTRTRPIEEAGEDLAQLGRGNPPLSDDLVARIKPVESVERLRGINLYGRLGLSALIVAACLGGPALYYRRKGRTQAT